MFTRIRYVILRVRDVPNMILFWKDKIGLKPSREANTWSEFPLENIVIALLQDKDALPKRTGIVFEVNDINETVERLKAKGVKVDEINDIGFGLLTFFKDPEGNEYEIFQPRPY